MIIRRDSTFHNVWNLYITFCCLFSCYNYSFIAAFGNETVLQMFIFEITFAIDMIINFFTEIAPLTEKAKPERRLDIIAKNYLKSQFLIDLVPLIPIQIFSYRSKELRLLYLPKIIRLRRGFKLFNTNSIMQFVKKIYKR